MAERKGEWYTGHNTLSEKQFIDGIGRHSRALMSRRALLVGYLAAAKRRTDWGSMNSDAVITYAKDALARESVMFKRRWV